MKKIGCYIPNVLLTFLLVFFLLAAEAVGFVKTQALNPELYRTVAQRESLSEKAYSSLDTYFRTRHNSTGIPAEVYMLPMEKAVLQEAIEDSLTQAFSYLNGKTDSYAFTMDFTELESSIDKFFIEYANAHNVALDDVYEAKVASVKAEAESEILFITDTFKFSTMYENGWLASAKHYIGFLNFAVLGCVGAAVILAVLLVLCNRKQLLHLLYWLGLGVSVSSLMAAFPCIYVMQTDYYSGFAIKDPQVFAAVVGSLKMMTGRLMGFEIFMFLVGIGMLILFASLLRAQQKSDKE